MKKPRKKSISLILLYVRVMVMLARGNANLQAQKELTHDISWKKDKQLTYRTQQANLNRGSKLKKRKLNQNNRLGESCGIFNTHNNHSRNRTNLKKKIGNLTQYNGIWESGIKNQFIIKS